MMRKIWTIEEDNFLKTHYCIDKTSVQCGIELNRSTSSVRNRAVKLALTNNTIWKGWEDNILIDNYASKGANYCKTFLPNRTLDSIRKRISRLGLVADSKTKTHEQYLLELVEKEIDIVPLEKYQSAQTPILHSCQNGHTWKICPSNVLRGNKCASCNKSNFKLSEPAILYYVKITKDNETYYKIGITNRTVEKRFEHDKDKVIEILLIEHFATGQEAKERETLILSQFKDKRITVDNFLKSNGNTELFLEDVLKLDE